METILSITQISSAILLIVVILLQDRGSGLGAVFGGEGNVYRTKRGFEKFLFSLTIVFATIFLVVTFVQTLVS